MNYKNTPTAKLRQHIKANPNDQEAWNEFVSRPTTGKRFPPLWEMNESQLTECREFLEEKLGGKVEFESWMLQKPGRK